MGVAYHKMFVTQWFVNITGVKSYLRLVVGKIFSEISRGEYEVLCTCSCWWCSAALASVARACAASVGGNGGAPLFPAATELLTAPSPSLVPSLPSAATDDDTPAPPSSPETNHLQYFHDYIFVTSPNQ